MRSSLCAHERSTVHTPKGIERESTEQRTLDLVLSMVSPFVMISPTAALHSLARHCICEAKAVYSVRRRGGRSAASRAACASDRFRGPVCPRLASGSALGLIGGVSGGVDGTGLGCSVLARSRPDET